ncbi:sugar-binding transcriptional regulator [Desulfocurvus sp. DL9XJH121]
MNKELERDEALKARVAWAYYNEGLTQAQIAKRIGISRVRVNRLLQHCREVGLVQVSINSGLSACAGLEFDLERAFGLRRAVVVPTPEDPGALYKAVGEAAAGYAAAALEEGQALGLGWGATLHGSLGGVPYYSGTRDNTVVSLFGGLPVSIATNPYSIASEYAKRLRAAKCLYIAAPMYAPSVEICGVLRAQAGFSEVHEQAARVDVALVGCGDMTAASTNVVLGALSPEEGRALHDAGAVAEIFGHFIGEDGEVVDHEVNARFTGPTMESLRSIPMTIVVAGGPQKTSALRAMLRGRYATVLVTDEDSARAVLA